MSDQPHKLRPGMPDNWQLEAHPADGDTVRLVDTATGKVGAWMSRFRDTDYLGRWCPMKKHLPTTEAEKHS